MGQLCPTMILLTLSLPLAIFSVCFNEMKFLRLLLFFDRNHMRILKAIIFSAVPLSLLLSSAAT